MHPCCSWSVESSLSSQESESGSLHRCCTVGANVSSAPPPALCEQHGHYPRAPPALLAMRYPHWAGRNGIVDWRDDRPSWKYQDLPDCFPPHWGSSVPQNCRRWKTLSKASPAWTCCPWKGCWAGAHCPLLAQKKEGTQLCRKLYYTLLDIFNETRQNVFSWLQSCSACSADYTCE